MSSTSNTQVYIDGPNVDMVLGREILGRRPYPDERPRWERVAAFCQDVLDCVKPTFVLNGDRFANGGIELFKFRRLLRDVFGYDVKCPSGTPGDPVDMFIQEQLRILARFHRPCSVAVMSHDHGYAADLDAILMLGGKVWVIGFPEEMSSKLLKLEDRGATILDVEHNLGAFDVILPRPFLNGWGARLTGSPTCPVVQGAGNP